MDRWLASPERAAGRQGQYQFTASHHANVVPTGFGSWFAVNAEDGIAAPAWKQAMTVLAALFPTVMILNLTVGNLVAGQGAPMAVNVFIGNTLGTVALTWLLMPVVTRLMAWWLSPGCAPNKTTVGVVLLLGIYAASSSFSRGRESRLAFFGRVSHAPIARGGQMLFQSPYLAVASTVDEALEAKRLTFSALYRRGTEVMADQNLELLQASGYVSLRSDRRASPIEDLPDGLRIGASVTIARLLDHPLIKRSRSCAERRAPSARARSAIAARSGATSRAALPTGRCCRACWP